MNAVSELEIYLQAVWRFGLRTVVTGLGLNNTRSGKKRRGKGQARYQPSLEKGAEKNARQSAALQIPTPEKENRVKEVSETSAPAGSVNGTLTEIRSIADLNGQTRDVRRDLQQGLTQMLPALAGFCQQRWLVLVAPPCLPTTEELNAAGIDPARVLRVHPGAGNGVDILEQTLRSGTCGAVLAWLEKGDAHTLDRLRRAAEAGNTWGVLFRGPKQGARAQVSAKPAAAVTQAGAQIKMAIS